MAHYFTDKDEETLKLIQECIAPLDECNRKDYLINCLVLKCRQNMTVKEIFEDELKAKKSFEEQLNA